MEPCPPPSRDALAHWTWDRPVGKTHRSDHQILMMFCDFKAGDVEPCGEGDDLKGVRWLEGLECCCGPFNAENRDVT